MEVRVRCENISYKCSLCIGAGGGGVQRVISPRQWLNYDTSVHLARHLPGVDNTNIKVKLQRTYILAAPWDGS